jgi:hypothetical protein
VSEVDLGNARIVLSPTPTGEGKPTPYKPSTFNSVAKLAERAPFAVKSPSAPLPGHELLDGELLTSPAVVAALTYVEKSTGRNYMIVQSPIENAENKPEVRAVGQAVSKSNVGSREVALVAGASPPGTPALVSVMWAEGGVLIQVSAAGYSTEEHVQVVLSL